MTADTEGAAPKARTLRLLADDPAETDLLSFEAIAQTIADALLDESLDPIALGLSGTWGSGKTTVLNLVEREVISRETDDKKVIVIRTAPWRYDPTQGAKETLIGEVLAAIGIELKVSADGSDKAGALLIRLTARVNWAKALKIAATTAVTLQLPDPAQLVDLVKPKSDEPKDARGLEHFRGEFESLISSEELEHVRSVVVLVDDLDRCLPATVVDSLEAMRLFLDVPKMSFVIAADEVRVADAIRARFSTTEVPAEDAGETEDPARLYLHKIVQTAFPLPALSSFDTLAYVLVLTLQSRDEPDALTTLIAQCSEIRRSGGDAQDLTAIDDFDYQSELEFAKRLTPMLHEKMKGNPRRIKRFVNDLEVRQVIAERRGIALDAGVVAKLMVLEVVLATEFTRMLDWFAAGQLKEKLVALEKEATTRPEVRPTQDETTAEESGQFSDGLIRWAKLSPPLEELDLSPYLTLAASFKGVVLVAKNLPERLRDIAANLLSDTRTDQSSVKDADLEALGEGDLVNLVEHLGRTLRDQPQRQKQGVNALLRMGRKFDTVRGNVVLALRELPGRDVKISTPIQFAAGDPAELKEVLSYWNQTAPEAVQRSISNALRQASA